MSEQQVEQMVVPTDIMIDIETVSTKTNALIVSIAAVTFNVYKHHQPIRQLELLVDVSEYIDKKLNKIEQNRMAQHENLTLFNQYNVLHDLD